MIVRKAILLSVLVLAFAATAFAADEVKPQDKSGVIKSADAKAKTFVLTREPRPLTFTVNDKTVITLEGKESTFEEALKPDQQATVTYVKSGEDRLASRVAVTAPPAKK